MRKTYPPTYFTMCLFRHSLLLLILISAAVPSLLALGDRPTAGLSKGKGVGIGALGGATTHIAQIQAASDLFAEISWQTVADQPYRVSEAQGKAVNGKLYTFGGFDSQKSCCTPTDRAYAYDPATNAWTAIAPLPPMNGTTHGGMTHAGIATDGTDIYFAGGYTSNLAGTGQRFGSKEVWKYLVAEDRYIRLPDLPIEISAGQLEYLNGKLHHIAGTNKARTEDLDNHYMLDLNNLAAGWQTRAALPNPRQHAGSAVYEGMIYYIGGQTGHDAQLATRKEVHRYDPATDNWDQMADLPVPAGASGRGHISSSVVVAGNRILVLGGETTHASGRTNMVSAYSPATNTWENLTPLPQNRYSGVAALLEGNLYYTGGGSDTQFYTNTTFKGVPSIITSVDHPLPKNQDPVSWLKVFPNPAAEGRATLQIENFGQRELVEVTVHDVTGRLLLFRTIVTDAHGGGGAELPLTKSLARGIILVRASAPSATRVVRLVVE